MAFLGTAALGLGALGIGSQFLGGRKRGKFEKEEAARQKKFIEQQEKDERRAALARAIGAQNLQLPSERFRPGALDTGLFDTLGAVGQFGSLAASQALARPQTNVQQRVVGGLRQGVR